MRKFLNIMKLGATALVVTQAGAAAPKPAVAPAIAPVSWELTFRYRDPQRVSVFLPDKPEPVVYWYMLYTIENNTDREVDFYPKFELVTDTLRVLPSEIRVSPEAFKAICRRSGEPLLVTPEKAVGRLLRGKDRARHSVAIWRDFDPKAKAFTIYVSGLSGEITRLRNPAFDPAKPQSETNKRYFILRKTLDIPYKLPGSESTRSHAIPERVLDGQKWIMR